MELRIDNRLTERSAELAELLDNDQDLLITAPTDSGKTYAIIDYADKTSKRVAFLMPTQVLVKNLKEDYKHTSIKAGYGKEFARDYKGHRFICTTYDSYHYFEKPFDIVVIDEAHLLAGHGNFRTEALAPLLNIECKKVMLSGTPEIIENINGFKRIDFVKPVRYKTAKIITSNVKSKTHAFNLIKDRNKKNLLILRINNKNTIDEIFNEFKDRCNIVKLYSDSEAVQYAEQDEQTLNELKNGRITHQVDVLLCTSILDAGISLEVNRDVDCFAISDNDMPNAIDIIQLYARVRTSSKYQMNLTIIGSFGSASIPTGYTLSGFEPELLIKVMSPIYKTYEELDEENYTNLLYKYGIRCDPRMQKEYSITDARYLSQIKPIQIVKSFNSYPELFLKLEDRARGKGCLDWLDNFRGDITINSKANSTVIRIYEQIDQAIVLSIPPAFYMDNAFHQKRLTSLIGSVDAFRYSMNFRAVMLLLLSGLNEQDKFKMNLDQYRKLSDVHQDYIKAVASLVYDGRKWNEKNITLKPKPRTQELETFLLNFLWADKSQAA